MAYFGASVAFIQQPHECEYNDTLFLYKVVELKLLHSQRMEYRQIASRATGSPGDDVDDNDCAAFGNAAATRRPLWHHITCSLTISTPPSSLMRLCRGSESRQG